MPRQGHNTPVPLERSAPGCFTRLLGSSVVPLPLVTEEDEYHKDDKDHGNCNHRDSCEEVPKPSPGRDSLHFSNGEDLKNKPPAGAKQRCQAQQSLGQHGEGHSGQREFRFDVQEATEHKSPEQPEWKDRDLRDRRPREGRA